MSLSIVSLASGSKGNATLVYSDKTAVLVDVGISYTRLNQELKEFGLCVSALDGIVITHEHFDHINGLLKACNECNIYAHYFTQKAIVDKDFGVRFEDFMDIENYMSGFLIGDIFVKPFRTSHDAAYPLGYTFSCKDAKVSVMTDTGTVDKEMFDSIKDSGAILLESNHDKDMLVNGPYTYVLKKRILSPVGHMSNSLCAKVVKKLCENGKTKEILLGHLSENNNTPELAYDEVMKVVQNAELKVYLTYPDRRSEVCEII